MLEFGMPTLIENRTLDDNIALPHKFIQKYAHECKHSSHILMKLRGSEQLQNI